MTKCTSVRFVDTNIRLYAVSTVPEDAKQAVAEQFLRARDLALSADLSGGRNYEGVTVVNPFL